MFNGNLNFELDSPAFEKKKKNIFIEWMFQTCIAISDQRLAWNIRYANTVWSPYFEWMKKAKRVKK